MKNHPLFHYYALCCLKTCLAFLFLFLVICQTNAQDKIRLSSGDWNQANQWIPFGVPTSGQTVGIGSNYTVTISAGFSAECANLTLTTNADIIIQNTGSLTVSGAFVTTPAFDVYSGSMITNNGDLYVNGYGNTVLNLRSGSTVTNDTMGQIFVNKATNTSYNAFVSSGTVHNYGEINIGNTADPIQSTALSASGNFTNHQNGSLLIHKANDTGISMTSGSFTNKGTCQIAISGTVLTGIYASLPILNDTTGIITIGGARNNGFSEPNLFSGGNVTNKGSITISYCTYGLAARFTNTNIGTITINHCTRGINLSFPGGSSSNAGTIHIGNTGNISSHGIAQSSNSDFTNTGIVNIDNANYGMNIVDSGTQFVNSGTVKIGNIAILGATGIDLGNSANLTNNAGAVLEINRCPNYSAMSVFNLSTLNNSGTIKMGNLQNIGGGFICWAGSQITNTATGLMEINRNSWVGFLVDQNNTLLTNDGTITSGNLASSATLIYCQNGGDFNNNSTGEVNADNLGTGIGVDGSGSICNNSGLIRIGDVTNIRDYGIHILNNGTFTNLADGEININKVDINWWAKPVYNEGGVFINNGTINIGNVGNVVTCHMGITSRSTSTNNGTITINNTNLRAIELYNASLFINNGNIIIGNINGSNEYGIRIEENSTFTNGSTGDLEINDINFNWWSKAIDIPDGTFSNSGNIEIGNQTVCSFGIYFNENFNNLGGGIITIDRITYAGIEAHTAVGSGTNNGQINIGNAVGCGFYGISMHDNSSFVNHAMGVITLNNATTNWWSGGMLVKNGLFSNLGTIRFGTISNLNTGIQLGENNTDTGMLTNDGTIEFDRISDGNRAAIFCDVSTIFTNNATGIIKFGYSQPVVVAFRGGGSATNFGQLLCKNIAYSTVMTGQTLYNKAGSTFKVFAGFTNYIDGTLLQATGSNFIIDGTLHNFGTVIATVN